VARALLEINSGTKAALTPCTKSKQRNQNDRGFEDWRGFDWTGDGKRSLLTNLYENKYKKALKRQGLSDDEINDRWDFSVGECMTKADIRSMCDLMKEVVDAQESPGGGVLMQSRTQDDIGAGCWPDFGVEVRDNCTIM
jgi:hypothetical protein